MGYILGNEPIVLVRLSVNRQEKRIADKELQYLNDTITEIESNFYMDLFSDTPHTYKDIYHFYEDLFTDYVCQAKNKIGKFYSVNPKYFYNNFKPLERCP